MLLSMTGYGRDNQILNGRDISIEMKSVNSRYFEYQSRMPRAFLYLDDRIKKTINKNISRGKVDFFMQINNVSAPEVTINANVEVARAYLNAINKIGEELEINSNINVTSLLKFNDIFTTTTAQIDEEQIWNDINIVLNNAINNFINMRKDEGVELKKDILSRLETIEKACIIIAETSEERVIKYTDKLYQRLQKVLEDTNISEDRILQEAAIYSDKTAIDEETVRIQSHIAQYREILNYYEPVGRKLDFLTQELNREINTIGSKCQDIEITKIVVMVKSEIEKIREQIQNIE